MEEWGQPATETSDGCADADADSSHPCRIQGRVRQSSHDQGASAAQTASQQGTGGTADARERHQSKAQAALQGHDGLKAQSADSPEPAESKPHARCAESSLDIRHTYLLTGEGWLYLAIVLDVFNREVVGWSLKPRMTADIVTDALTMAWLRRKPAAGLIHQSDRGNQYVNLIFQAKLKVYGMICSMSRKGNCWDNAPTESWFGGFKNERVYGERFETRGGVIAMTFEYIEVFYNRRRLHSTLGYKSPMQFLNNWISARQQEKLVA
jgi:hypothetical protein